MENTNLQNYLNAMTLESFAEIRSSQEPKDRLRYFDVVLEGSTESNAILLQKLYVDIISKSNIDYGQIPDSQGAFTNYQGYKQMSLAMGYLNKLFEGTSSNEIKLMNELHDMIIACRKDYEFGYKFGVEIIKTMYCVSVLTLYELINVCILKYTKRMRNDTFINLSFSDKKKKDIIVIRGAKSLVKGYKDGQWSKLMIEIRKNPEILKYGAAVPANEAGLGAAIAGFKTLAMAHPAVSIPVGIVLAFITILVSIRLLVYWFYKGTSSIKESAKRQKEFVDFAISQDKAKGVSENIVNKEQKLSGRLGSIVNWIEVHILKTNKDAEKELEESNKENYAKKDFVSNQVGFGGNIEF